MPEEKAGIGGVGYGLLRTDPQPQLTLFSHFRLQLVHAQADIPHLHHVNEAPQLVNAVYAYKIINHGSGSSNGKSRILDPDPENHPIRDPDPNFELQIDKKGHQHLTKFVISGT